MRRRDKIPTRLLFGDLPAAAGAETTCVGEGVELTGVVGVCPKMIPCHRVDLTSDRRGDRICLANNDLTISVVVGSEVSRSPALCFLVGEARVAGSTFSVSTSSKLGASWRRLRLVVGVVKIASSYVNT